MIGKALGLSIGLAGLGAAGKVGYDYLGSNQFMKSSQPDMSALSNKSFFYGGMTDMFSGTGLVANLAAEFGSRGLAKHLQSRAMNNLMVSSAMRGQGYKYSGGTFGRWSNEAGREFSASGAKQWIKSKKNGLDPLHRARDAFNDPGYDKEEQRILKRLNKASPREATRMAREISGDKNVARSSLRTLKTARKIRTFGRMAAWAPMAYMAFDMGSSLGNMPAPSTDTRPRKSGALSGTFIDTGMAYTQRKRALQAMHNSQYGGRSGLGNEAALLHQ